MTNATTNATTPRARHRRPAELAGLTPQGDGLWRQPGGGGAPFALNFGPDGWIEAHTRFEPCGHADGVDASAAILSAHADWSGPVKLETDDGRCRSRISLDVGRAATAPSTHDSMHDADESAAAEHLTVALLKRIPDWFRGGTGAEGWQPPEIDALREWIQETGLEATPDKDGGLRFTLKRGGVDGQARVECRPGRLRFTLPLGRWRGLPPAARAAMQGLALEANDRCRLVRIAWIESEAGETRVEAQVDLSGMPVGPGESAPWRDWTHLAIDGLSLALRRLGLELPILADARNRTLAETLAASYGGAVAAH
jgi:hypothetical protein